MQIGSVLFPVLAFKAFLCRRRSRRCAGGLGLRWLLGIGSRGGLAAAGGRSAGGGACGSGRNDGRFTHNIMFLFVLALVESSQQDLSQET